MQRLLLLFVLTITNSLICTELQNQSEYIKASSNQLLEKGGCCERGHRGYRGHKGHRGPRGVQGPQGASGAAGNKGPTGPAGLNQRVYTCEPCPYQTITFSFRTNPFPPLTTGSFAVVITYPDGRFIQQTISVLPFPFTVSLFTDNPYQIGNYTISFINIDISIPVTQPLIQSLSINHPCFITGNITYTDFPNGWPVNNGQGTELYFAAPPCAPQLI